MERRCLMVPRQPPVAGMKQVEKTVTSAEEFSFGEIKYEKPGKYTYYIAETTPAKSDPSWLGGVSYSSAEYKVTVTVRMTAREI